MSSATRSDRAFWIAAVAVLGLVVTPLLHAEQHCREEHEDEAEALADAWKAGSTDPLEKLAFALAHAHGSQRPRSPEEHGHSHGPAGPRPHGDGALAHLNIALHGAPRLPEVRATAPDHVAPAAAVAQLRSTLRYLVSEWSQGPPAGC